MERITLKCFHCGNTKEVLCEGPLTFAFELCAIANNAGMLGIIDNHQSRAVVFCNDECLNAEKTKKGTIRIRPIGIKKATDL